mmetsp:Transcript_73289/g.203263  ORF Transcript_73289/g.203263 Transcript_73289/m.203263 type:complete len:207 (+) Transcript_73289:486-1106(+)
MRRCWRLEAHSSTHRGSPASHRKQRSAVRVGGFAHGLCRGHRRLRRRTPLAGCSAFFKADGGTQCPAGQRRAQHGNRSVLQMLALAVGSHLAVRISAIEAGTRRRGLPVRCRGVQAGPAMGPRVGADLGDVRATRDRADGGDVHRRAPSVCRAATLGVCGGSTRVDARGRRGAQRARVQLRSAGLCDGAAVVSRFGTLTRSLASRL